MRRRSLRGVLVFAVCLFVLPLNIITLALSRNLIGVTQNRLLNSYEQELALYCQLLDNDLALLKKETEALLDGSEELFHALAQRPSDQILLHELWSELGAVIDRMACFSVGYAVIRDTGEVYLNYKGGELSVESAERLKAFLAGSDWRAALPTNGELGLCAAGGERYFIFDLEFEALSLGFLLPLQSVFDAMEPFRTPGEIIDIAPASEASSAQTEGERRAIGVRFFDGAYVLRRQIEARTFRAAVGGTQAVLTGLTALSFCVIPLLWFLIHRIVILPMRRMRQGLDQVKRNNLSFRMDETADTREFAELFHSFNQMTGEIRSLRIETHEREIEALQMEIENLRLQVNPHLLINSFNMIYNLACSGDCTRIEDYTLHLVQYFRYALWQRDRQVELSREFASAGDYLEIQKIRFPGEIEYETALEAGLEKAPVPPFLIQNFVENSVKYGRMPGRKIHIRCEAAREGERVHIRVRDDGLGFEEETLEAVRAGGIFEDARGAHIGIHNCRRRLELLYGERATIEIDSAPGRGCTVHICLPMEV